MDLKEILRDPINSLLIGSLLSGTIASLVASIIFTQWQHRIKSKLRFAKIISWIKNEGINDFYQIKIKNDGKREIINLKFEIKLIKKLIVPEGRVTYSINLPLKFSNHMILPVQNKEKFNGHFSISFNLNDDDFILKLKNEARKRNILTDLEVNSLEQKKLSLVEILNSFDKIKCYVVCTDPSSGTTTIHTQDYFKSDIEHGSFIPGTLDIKYASNRL